MWPLRFGKSNLELISDLQSIADSINAEISPEGLAHTVLQTVSALTDSQSGAFYSRRGLSNRFQALASFPVKSSSQAEMQAQFSEKSISEFRSVSHLTRSSDLPLSENYRPISGKINNDLLMPIICRNRLQAMVILARNSNRMFSEQDLRLCRFLKSVVEIYYSRFIERQTRENYLDAVKHLVDYQARDIDSLIEPIFQALSRLVPIKFISLWLYNQLDDSLVMRSFCPDTIGKKKVTLALFDNTVIFCKDCLSGEVIRTRLPKLYSDVGQQQHFSNPNFSRRFDLRWFVSFPVTDGIEKPLGVLNLWPAGEVADFEDDVQRLISALIVPLASKIKVAHLQDSESLPFSYDDIFSNMLAFTDRRKYWDSLASTVASQMKCEACSIFVCDTSGILRLKGSTGIFGDPDYVGLSYLRGEGLTGHVFATGDPIIYYSELSSEYQGIHIGKIRDKLKTSRQTKSILFAPIIDEDGHPIGVIRCNNKEVSPSTSIGRFTEEDITKLTKISKLISNLYRKTVWIAQLERERERNVNSLHHEMISPLDGILAHCEWMQKHIRESNVQALDFHKISLKLQDLNQTAWLLYMLVNTMGRLEDGTQMEMSPISCHDLLQTSISFLLNEARRQRVHIEVAHLGLPKIHADGKQLLRVFYNLLRNAIKYRDQAETKSYCMVSAVEDDVSIMLRFEDNGIGVVEGEERKIFVRFERGSNAQIVFPEGTGLGLAYCADIIRAHDGDIYVDGDYTRKPTVFVIKLPKRLDG